MNKRKRSNLVFSSVGDLSVHNAWRMTTMRNYDLCLAYYGDTPGKYQEEAEIYFSRKGTKNQNFFWFYQNKPEILASYKNIFYLDDDILIDPNSINLVFDIFDQYDLWAAQPAFTSYSDTTWDLVKQKKGALLRFTNFVENGVMVFKSKLLPKFATLFKESVTGWGVDLLLSEFLGNPQNKIAVIDVVTCYHPKRRGQSELEKIMPRKEHIQQGKKLYQKYAKSDVFQFKEFGTVPISEIKKIQQRRPSPGKSLPTFSLKKLEEEFQRGNYVPHWELFFAVFSYFSERVVMQFPENLLAYIKTYVSTFLKYYTNPAFPVSRDQVRRLMPQNAMIANMLALIGSENTDRLLAELKDKGLFERIYLLYSVRNKTVCTVKELFDFDQELASLWYMYFYDLYTTAIFREDCYNNYQKHLREFDPRLDPLCPVLSRVYYACSYVDPQQDAPLKRLLNRQVQDRFKVSLEFGPEYKNNKIAVFSACWKNTHAVYKNQCHFIESLRDNYELTFFPLHDKQDPSLFHKVNTKCLHGALDLEPVLQEKFHLAYFPDVGMHEKSVILANLRIAPVQVACFGHSVSTHGSNIDYYIVGDGIEDLSKYEENYSERLVVIPGLGIVNKLPAYKRKGLKGARDPLVISMPAAAHKLNYSYLCCVKEILESVDRPVRLRIFAAGAAARYLGLSIVYREIREILGIEQLEVHPHLPYKQYMELLEQSDLALDAFHYGGCNGVIDCLWTGVPILGWCGSKWYNRVGPKQMEAVGLHELVVRNREDYISKGKNLILDDDYRGSVRKRMREIDLANSVLLDRSAVTGFKKAIDHLMSLDFQMNDDKTPIIIGG